MALSFFKVINPINTSGKYCTGNLGDGSTQPALKLGAYVKTIPAAAHTDLSASCDPELLI
jgi:hypothetical protein